MNSKKLLQHKQLNLTPYHVHCTYKHKQDTICVTQWTNLHLVHCCFVKWIIYLWQHPNCPTYKNHSFFSLTTEAEKLTFCLFFTLGKQESTLTWILRFPKRHESWSRVDKNKDVSSQHAKERKVLISSVNSNSYKCALQQNLSQFRIVTEINNCISAVNKNWCFFTATSQQRKLIYTAKCTFIENGSTEALGPVTRLYRSITGWMAAVLCIHLW